MLNFVKAATIIFICFKYFLEFQHFILNLNSFFVLISFKNKNFYISKLMKIDKLKLVLENFHNFFLEKFNKLEKKV